MNDPDRLLRYISETRFRRYLEDAEGDKLKALKLYEWNAQLSAAFVVPIHHFEVGIRNVFYSQIAESLENEYWYRSERSAVQVEQELRERTGIKKVAPGAVVAKLTFGFWVSLTSTHHHDRYWISVLSELFPHRAKRPSRKLVNKELSSVQHLRNRVAHHEPIYNRNLEHNWERMQQFLGWIDPELQKWVGSETQVSQILQQDPRTPKNYA